MTKSQFGYFGFGSLVNKHTLRTDYISMTPARLSGWKRFWQGRPGGEMRDIALLSVFEDPQTSIDGVLIIDREENLPALDLREAHYDRHIVNPDRLDMLENTQLPDEIYIYVARKGADIKTDNSPLLQSYLDAVMQGFYNEHGEEGVFDFLETTYGFSRPIICDRNAPQYPRCVELETDMAKWFDHLLAMQGVTFNSTDS